MKERLNTLFARLEDNEENGLQSSYMGAAEYEFGSSHAALKSLTVDFGIPHEVVTTNIVLDPKELARWQPKRKRLAGKLVFNHKYDERDYKDIEAMKDGKPLSFRFLPAIVNDELMGKMMDIKSFDNVFNKGGLFDFHTKAWLTLYPVPGILYHPSQKKAVDKYIDTYTAKYAQSNPDPEKLKEETIQKFRAEGDTYDLVKLAEALPETKTGIIQNIRKLIGFRLNRDNDSMEL